MISPKYQWIHWFIDTGPTADYSKSGIKKSIRIFIMNKYDVCIFFAEGRWMQHGGCETGGQWDDFLSTFAFT